MLLRETDVREIHFRYLLLQRQYLNNSDRKNYFLATCSHLDEYSNLDFINETCPHGGLIGIGDSYLEGILKHFKLFRLHAALHDACGYMKSVHSSGPGYSYVVPCKFSSCFIGHITGLGFCIYLRVNNPNLYHALQC